MIRVAIIGASHWHLPLYLDPLLEVPGAQVVGVADPDATVVDALAARLDCAGDTDFRALCRRVKPDFVIALGRHRQMAKIAHDLLDAGYPFMMEKPMGVNAQEVQTIADKAARPSRAAPATTRPQTRSRLPRSRRCPWRSSSRVRRRRPGSRTCSRRPARPAPVSASAGRGRAGASAGQTPRKRPGRGRARPWPTSPATGAARGRRGHEPGAPRVRDDSTGAGEQA